MTRDAPSRAKAVAAMQDLQGRSPLVASAKPREPEKPPSGVLLSSKHSATQGTAFQLYSDAVRAGGSGADGDAAEDKPPPASTEVVHSTIELRRQSSCLALTGLI